MKIPGSIRSLYTAQEEPNKRLKELVDNKLTAIMHPRWHYESRIKPEESFALKVESGRYSKSELDNLEDFFACTLVVENQTSVNIAEELVDTLFVVYERRPKNFSWTHKSSNAFPFDDLRLYTKWKDDLTQRPSGLTDIIFEIQIRTFLQHAWSVATHDLVYKSSNANWPKMRIASQIKAMLEHAEISIAEAELLSKSPGLSRTDKYTNDLKDTMEVINDVWSEGLPVDVIRFANTVNMFLKNVGINLRRLKEILHAETSEGRGSELKNLSPYGVIVQSVMMHETEKFATYLEKTEAGSPFFIVFPRELDIPERIRLINTDKKIFIDDVNFL